jgi:hypothetical protein
MAKSSYPNALYRLAQAVGELARRLPPDQATRAAQRILDAMARAPYPSTLPPLAEAVGRLAGRLPPEQGAAVNARAAQRILDAMAKSAEPSALSPLAQAVGETARRLPPDQAAAVTTKAAQRILDSMPKAASPYLLSQLAQAVGELARRLPPDQAARAAQHALDAMTRTTHRDSLNALEQVAARLRARCSKQGVIDLLKQPTCVGAVRRGALEELTRRLGPPAPQAVASTLAAVQASPLAATAMAVYTDSLYPGFRRPFPGLWEAVDWLRKEHPELDFASPARRLNR